VICAQAPDVRVDEENREAFLREAERCFEEYGGNWRSPNIVRHRIGDQELFLVDDTAQVVGAFKIRGAWTAVCELKRREPGLAHVTAASSGSFGMSVACAASHFGLRATICMPSSAPRCKQDKIRGFGAEVVAEDVSYEDAKTRARGYENPENGTRFIDGVGWDVFKGNASLPLAMYRSGLLDAASVAVVTPLGIGSLGVPLAVTLRGLGVDCSVFMAEPLLYGKLLNEVHSVPLPWGHTLADGAAVRELPEFSADLVRSSADWVCGLSEEEIERAMHWMEETLGIVAEGAGALAAAAWLADPERFKPYRQVWLMVTGKNRQHGTD